MIGNGTTVWCENRLCENAEYFADGDSYYCTKEIIKVKNRGCEDYEPKKHCEDCWKFHRDECWQGDFADRDEEPCDEFQEFPFN